MKAGEFPALADLFAQLSVVSALLGGFAFTFVGALLGLSAESRIFAWVFGASLAAALAFTVTALGAVLVSLAVRNAFPVDIASLHQKISLAFLLGIGSFLVATGTCGWLKGRRLGWMSTVIAGLSAFGVGSVLAPFIAFS
jgi:hypothetical protein